MTEPPQAILDLVERFSSNVDLYRSPSYNETQARREFIDPFFAALGWDVDNTRGVSPRYREVIHEASLRVGGSVTAPDYCFRVGTERKFFVEAKKPAVSIQTDIQPAYQLRRYAWTAKLPLSILTDFEEFSVYDCRFRPKPGDKASQARVLSLTYDQYPERWDEIASIFSREAVWKGDYDRYAQTTRGKRGTQEVDREFLKEIEGWRVVLARNIALRNEDLSVRELNYAVQKTIDRILFLRICEDRGIEPYEQLKDIANGTDSYGRLLDLFRRADERFNSGIFHFREEKGRNETPDSLTPTLAVDDKVLRGIISKLYYPDSPYEFSVLSVEILGNVYEQFLGSVIRLTPKHRAVVEQKPEVRKAGGVYYTPKYIVEYIVEHTVGELCKGKTPGEVARLRILDPACGSGSFLLGAYEYLLNYHLDWYVEHQTKRGRQEIYEGRGGDWFLTTEEKKRILLNNIYGVDIDPQAVEVTKLSLLLKVLEAETRDSLGQQLELIRERALPDLASNIKCGNSLIGPDFYDGEQLSLLDAEEMYRINPFDWEAQFAEIMQAGGFDVVISNPPYGATLGANDAEYLADKFQAFSAVRDVYVAFIEQAHRLLSASGYFGYIIPSAWTGGPMYRPLRSFLLQKTICSLVFLPFDVFADAYIDTAVLTTCNTASSKGHRVLTHTYPKKAKLSSIDLTSQRYRKPLQAEWETIQDQKFVPDVAALALIRRVVDSISTRLSDFVGLKRGVLFDRKLLTEEKTGPKSFLYFEGDVYRYRMNPRWDRWVEFGSKMKEYPKDFYWFEGPRILLRRLVNRRKRMMATLFEATVITNKNLYVVRSLREETPLPYLLGILNSRLISYLYLRQVSQATKDDFPQLTIRDLKALPVPLPDARRREEMVSKVGKILWLHKQLADAKTPTAKELLQRQINATDRQIDRLVYELYGLTEEEIEIVEEATG